MTESNEKKIHDGIVNGHKEDIDSLRNEFLNRDNSIRKDLNQHYDDDIVAFGKVHDKLNVTIDQNKEILKYIKGDPTTGEEGIIQQLKPIKNLKGFWSVIGFVLAGVALIAAGVAGFFFLKSHFLEFWD